LFPIFLEMPRPGLADPVIAADAAERLDRGFDPVDVRIAQHRQIPETAHAAGMQLPFQRLADAGDELEIVGLRRNGARGGLRRQGSALWVVGVGLAGLLAATLAHGLVDHSFFLVDLAFVFMLACGLAAQLARQATQETPS